MRRINYLVMICALALSFSACKSSKPLSRPTPPTPPTPQVATTQPVAQAQPTQQPTYTPTTTSNVVARTESVSQAAGETGALYKYNVIVGSFQNFNNATNLKTKMIGRNYKTQLLQNAQGMYRVCVFSSNDENQARQTVQTIRNNYPNEFADAWLLIAQ